MDALAIDPKHPSTVYLAAGKLFKSVDAGRSWRRLNLPSGGKAQALALNPGDPDVVYVGTSIGVFGSVDGGKRWSGMNGGLTNKHVSALAVDPRSPATL